MNSILTAAIQSLVGLCVIFPFGVAAQTPVHTVPGVIIDWVPASTQQYIGSPSLAFLPDGTFVASHDLFGPGSSKDKTVVFSSSDQGQTWTKISEITGQWWSSLFFHQGSLYLMGTSRENGYAAIRRSADGGKTWTNPTDEKTGLLFGDGRYHTAPVPVVVHHGRIWRAMEDTMGTGNWGDYFHAFMMSAPADADLLDAGNWTASNRLGKDPSYLEGKFGGWLEGNAVATPDGKIVNILRVDHPEYPEKAAIIEISEDGRQAAFDPTTGFIQLPGGAKKFTIRPDAQTSRYITLVNYVPEQYRSTPPPGTRNTLALASSADLKSWKVHSIILQHPDTEKHAFQYVDWLFLGDDLAVVSRTAYDDGVGGAHNYHDANYMTFHKIKNFRSLLDQTIE